MGLCCTAQTPTYTRSLTERLRKSFRPLPKPGFGHKLERYSNDLKKRVSTQFNHNVAIKFIESSVTIHSDQDIEFQIRLITSLGQKPTLKTIKKPNAAPFDPFMPPIEAELYIAELSQTHNLLFNKFCICKEHCLVTTKVMERQDSAVTLQDFNAILLACQSLDAFVFFNRGYLSGMSILHKHFQLIPFESMVVGNTSKEGTDVRPGSENDTNLLPVERAILKELGGQDISQGCITSFGGFAGMQHVVKIFSEKG